MLKQLRKKREEGFTLIELLVTLLILAILLAIGVAAYLGYTDKAYDSKAKSQLNVAYKAAKADAIEEPNQGEYRISRLGGPDGAIKASEPELNVGGTALAPSVDCTDFPVLDAGPPAVPAVEATVYVCDDSTATSLHLAYLSQSGNTVELTAPAFGSPEYAVTED